jgi:hypothetical protein
MQRTQNTDIPNKVMLPATKTRCSAAGFFSNTITQNTLTSSTETGLLQRNYGKRLSSVTVRPECSQQIVY